MKRSLIAAFLLLQFWGCGKNVGLEGPESSIDEPDRDLFDRGLRDLNRNRHTMARLTLQTLINTYPDSEYLPQAKYAMAESFYREGTSSALLQAEAEFRDFITFFPTSDMADDAQLMIALTHIRQMEKADRDRTQALMAEIELKNMIQNYPDSPLLDDAKDKLRGVQEVLAEGVLRIANFYHIKKSYPAAISRYKEVLEKYPDYSQSGEVLYNLAESLRQNDNEPEGVIYYTRLVRDHPLSDRVKDAKEKLIALDSPVPEANPVALARAEENRQANRGVLGRVMGMFSRRPGVSTETDAASVANESREQEEARKSEGGGTKPEGDAKKTDTKGSGSFGIEGTVVNPNQKPPVKKP